LGARRERGLTCTAGERTRTHRRKLKGRKVKDDEVKGVSPEEEAPEPNEAPGEAAGSTAPESDVALRPITSKMVAENFRGVGRGPLGVVAEKLGMGSDGALLESHLLLAEHLHMAGVRASTVPCLVIRDDDADGDGNVCASTRVEGIDDEALGAIEQLAGRQLPFAAGSLVHAARAYELEPDNDRSRLLLKRCLEGVADSAGTILAVAEEQRRRSE